MPHATMTKIFGGPITASLYEDQSILYFADQSPIASITPSLSEAGRQDHHEPALAIVRAVNSHDAMLMALKQAEAWLEGWASANPELAVIRTAIALAEAST